jgi:hypothetical protein
MRQNPIQNLIKSITARDLKTCSRCGCQNLAWVQYKSGKWGLVGTSTRRPYWQGEGVAPTGLWLIKTSFHNCEEYKNKKAEEAEQLAKYQVAYDDKQTRAAWCHPKADNPGEILTDAFVYLYKTYLVEFQDVKSPIFQAANILGKAAAYVAPTNFDKI